MLIAASIIAGLAVAVTPFALLGSTVDAAIIAGIFSVVNTWLNVKMITELRKTKHEVQPVIDVASRVTHRRGDIETKDDD